MGGRRGRTAAMGVAALLTLAVATGGVLVLMRVHSGPAEQQEWTATVIAADAGVAALAVTLLGFLWTATARRRAAAGVPARLIETEAVGTKDGRWPRLEQVPLEILGVREPRTAGGRRRSQLPYVPRAELDPVLRTVLGAHRFVLVHGPAASGKSRSVAETCAALFGDLPAVIPAQRDGALARLVDGGAVPGVAVVWLDDLDRHLQAGVDVGLLKRLLTRPGTRVVATMRAGAYEQLKPSGDIRPRGRDVVELAEQVEYTGWDDDDRAEASRRLAGQPEITAALNRGTGLGAFLSVGPELVDRLRTGSPPAGGVAVVYAAVDWYRAGMTRPAPAELVRSLYSGYLPEDDAALLGHYNDALGWATTPVSGARLVTRRTDGTGLAVDDYVLDHLSTSLPPGLPVKTWTAIAAVLHDDLDALATASATAYLIHRDPTTAEHLARQAADAGHTGAMFTLGVLLSERGQPEGAESWWRQAATAGHTGAMANLGIRLWKRGKLEEAEGWWRRAATAANTDAMSHLGLLLNERGQAEEAEYWYRIAVLLGSTDAMSNLGLLLNERGQPEEAERWWRQAAATGHTDAMGNLGTLLKRRGQPEEAEHWWRQAAAAGNDGAMFELGVLRYERGQKEAAAGWWRQAAAAGRTLAMYNLAVVLTELSQPEPAEQWMRQAAAAGHTNAMSHLGTLLSTRGELAEAEPWLRRAAIAGHTNAMSNLGTLLYQQSHAEDAEHWWRKAATAGHAKAMSQLGHLLQTRGLAPVIHGRSVVAAD